MCVCAPEITYLYFRNSTSLIASFPVLTELPITCSTLNRTASDWKLGEGLRTRLTNSAWTVMLSVHAQNQLEELADLLGAEVVDSFCNDGELQLCMSAKKTPIFEIWYSLSNLIMQYICLCQKHLFICVVSHVITMCDKRGCCSRTLKFLCAVALGKWIVSFQCK